MNLFPGKEAELFRAANLFELQEFVRSQKAIMIPHHVAYRQGWRGLDWNGWQPDISPLSEAFSEHGNTLEAPTHWPMLGHSMGGSCRSQTVLHQIRKGSILGFTGGTDNHFGHPASYGEGLTGILAGELTRESVFSALKARHVFATSGDRIEFRINCTPMLKVIGSWPRTSFKKSRHLCSSPKTERSFHGSAKHENTKILIFRTRPPTLTQV